MRSTTRREVFVRTAPVRATVVRMIQPGQSSSAEIQTQTSDTGLLSRTFGIYHSVATDALAATCRGVLISHLAPGNSTISWSGRLVRFSTSHATVGALISLGIRL